MTTKKKGQITEVQRITDEANDSIQLYQERLAELELAMEDVGWLQMGVLDDREFSRSGLKQLVRLARFSYLKNPLIRNGVRVQANYVFGQGVEISSKYEDVNDLIQAFLEDRVNQRELTGHKARWERDIALTVEGNLFFALPTNPATGAVKVRSIDFEEITDVITNPEDSHEPWFYKREWTQRTGEGVDGSAHDGGQMMVCYHPDIQYRPKSRTPSLNGKEIKWDQPVYHVKVGGFNHMRFGIPEVYAAMDWARAIKEDLEDYATIRRALSRFAWSLTTKGGPGAVRAAKTKLQTGISLDSQETNPQPPAGSTFVQSEGTALNPIRTAGMAPDPEEGRRLWLMASAGLGIPETILSGNADVGNLATAKTLDRPTELNMMNRQQMWADILRDILGYAIDESVRATSGKLDGAIEINEYTGQEEIKLQLADKEGNDAEELSYRSIDIDFPPILEHDIQQTVGAIVSAATLDGKSKAGTMDDRTLVKLLLSALGEDDIDEIIEALENEETEDDGDAEPDMTPGAGDIAPPLPGTTSPPVPPVQMPPGKVPPVQQESLIQALRSFKETARLVLPSLVQAEVLQEADPLRDAMTHMAEHHPHLKTEGKTLGQLKQVHASAHSNSKNIDHSHPEGGFVMETVKA